MSRLAHREGHHSKVSRCKWNQKSAFLCPASCVRDRHPVQERSTQVVACFRNHSHLLYTWIALIERRESEGEKPENLDIYLENLLAIAI